MAQDRLLAHVQSAGRAQSQVRMAAGRRAAAQRRILAGEPKRGDRAWAGPAFQLELDATDMAPAVVETARALLLGGWRGGYEDLRTVAESIHTEVPG